METFLAVLIALGIFIGIPVIIVVTYIGIATGLFKVLKYRTQRRISAYRRTSSKIPESSILENVSK